MTQPTDMLAMVLDSTRTPLQLKRVRIPEPAEGQILVRVSACGVCRTDLHILDGDLKEPRLPLILGHEIVGTVERCGRGVNHIQEGDRVGIPWLGWTCGNCRYCRNHQENLCQSARFTGYTLDGGFAEYALADQRYCFLLSDLHDDLQTAPLLCAGLIGYRSYRMAGDSGNILGIYGFGAAAHVITQIAVYEGRQVLAFTSPGDTAKQDFARKLGACWAGGSDQPSPQELDAAIIFAPVGSLIPTALRAVRPGGRVICGGIHMSDIPSFPYEWLWGERIIQSVANLTRQDGEELFKSARRANVVTQVTAYRLSDANRALDDLRNGRLQGAAVLLC